MSRFVSPYYPPRARWYGPLRAWRDACRRRLSLDRLSLPGVSLPGAIASLFIPGLAFFVRGFRLWGSLAMAGSVLLLAVFVVELGRPAGNLAFGLLLSLHATGLNFLFEPWLVGARFRFRVALALALLALLAAILYLPARGYIQDHWATPLFVNGRVVIVSKLPAAPVLKRGDWVAYSWPQAGDHDSGYVQAGFGLAPVLALAGDRVTFTEAGFTVNGTAHPAREYMPGSGQWTVPPGHFFIWPDMQIAGHGFSQSAISSLMLQLANVAPGQISGKPFHRWFWHRQFDL